MIAADLPQAFASLPAAWRAAAPAWTTGDEAALVRAVRDASADRPIGPADPFRALRMVAPADVRVLLIGQDPYPTPGHADGLAFSAARGRPASLRRVFEVLMADRPGWQPPAHGALDAWARQGVLLLNTALTVELGRAGAHLACGWQALTGACVAALYRRADPPVALLWGAHAQRFFDQATAGIAIDLRRVRRTRHPSYDFHKAFMADGSHFAATADRIDWWAL